MSARCTYEWAVVGRAGAPSVLYYRRCKRKTKSEDERCWQHHGGSGRFDRRVGR